MDLSGSGLGFTGDPENFFTAPAGRQPPSNTIATENESLFNEEINSRLKWMVLDAPDTAEILELDGHGEPQWRPLLTTPNHPFAHKSVTNPPRSRMLIVLTMIQSWEYWHDALAEDSCPAPLLIENADGQPISVAQLIAELHEYIKHLRDLIYEIEDRDPSENARLYLLGVVGPKRKDAGNADAQFWVHLDSDVVMNALNEEVWVRKAQRFARQQNPSY